VTATLAESVRLRLEEFFGEDLTPVRLHSGKAVAMALSAMRVHGIVFGRRILLSADAARLCAEGDERTGGFLAHEVCHVLQYRRMGFWRFLAAYVAAYGRHGFSYARIPFEIEAFETERRFREAASERPMAYASRMSEPRAASTSDGLSSRKV
jgi:hypothetical protein